MWRVYVVILGFCRLWAAAQGLLGLATVWIAVWWSQKYSADDIYLSLFDYSLHGEDQRRDMNTVEVASFDMEMMNW